MLDNAIRNKIISQEVYDVLLTCVFENVYTSQSQIKEQIAAATVDSNLEENTVNRPCRSASSITLDKLTRKQPALSTRKRPALSNSSSKNKKSRIENPVSAAFLSAAATKKKKKKKQVRTINTSRIDAYKERKTSPTTTPTTDCSVQPTKYHKTFLRNVHNILSQWIRDDKNDENFVHQPKSILGVIGWWIHNVSMNHFFG